MTSKDSAKITISWPTSHHPGDDLRMIEQSMEAAQDDGPLLVLPLERGRGPKKAEFVPSIFPDVSHYLANVSEYGTDLGGERCVAIVQHGADESIGLALLRHLQQIAAPGTDGVPHRRLEKRKTEPMDRHIIPAASNPMPAVRIENFGEGLADALAVYPKLRPLVCASEDEM